MSVHLHTPFASTSRPESDVLEIGLVNNLSDAGLEGGERQFIDLLTRTAGSRTVRLRLFSLPGIPRGVVARDRIERLYTPYSALFDADLDGLIVTGCEPRAARLDDERFWPHMTKVIDWAQTHTRSAIWSCLAAHAAVLHLDGIVRRPLKRKRSGVYRVDRAAAHPLLHGAGSQLWVPHSRHNDLEETDLTKAGYGILTRSDSAGVDAFIRQGHSLFLFLQGHPEYDADALYREYRRDVIRFIDGTSDVYPTLPEHYFAADMETALQAFAVKACLQREPYLMESFPSGRRGRTATPWNDECALTMFSNWLGGLCAMTAEHVA